MQHWQMTIWKWAAVHLAIALCAEDLGSNGGRRRPRHNNFDNSTMLPTLLLQILNNLQHTSVGAGTGPSPVGLQL